MREEDDALVTCARDDADRDNDEDDAVLKAAGRAADGLPDDAPAPIARLAR